ncbi:leucyl aminopeptidase family protein [Kamptonema cortianum]|nr:leucyl aminopeptidase family protein [Geitlerinema splendidum]MDK3158481.1 leucyl aminopeptidase family protein [Kamptonema cortianum]
MFHSVSLDRVPHPDAIATCVFDDLALPVDADPALAEASKRPEFSGKRGQVVEAFPSQGPRIFLLGLGSESELNAETFRLACLSLAARVDASKITSIHIDFRNLPDARTLGQALGVAFGLTAFDARNMRGSLAEQGSQVDLKVAALDEDLDKGLMRGLGIARAVNFTRWLANTPPNIATPSWLADQARKISEEHSHLSVRVFEGPDLESEQLTGLMNVGRASVNKPCMIRIAYNPPGSEGKKPVVLVGKAITFDAGGFTLKSRNSLVGMKIDKAGGCAMMGAMKAIASTVQPNFPVVALIMAAENLISENAYRPDDVLTFRNGVTVEITSTDAEGRLVLADGISYACDVENPDCIIDMATLTGGVVNALGSIYAGVFTEHDELCNELIDSGNRTGERLWRLPVGNEHRELLESKVADVVNSAFGKNAYASQGAAFLTLFAREDIPFAHIDIAGVGSSRNDDFTREGPSGFGVRLIADFVTSRM